MAVCSIEYGVATATIWHRRCEGSVRGRESMAVWMIFSGVVLAAIEMVIGRAYFAAVWRSMEVF